MSGGRGPQQKKIKQGQKFNIDRKIDPTVIRTKNLKTWLSNYTYKIIRIFGRERFALEKKSTVKCSLPQ
jgi:Xaa-Pro aminopeptidase